MTEETQLEYEEEYYDEEEEGGDYNEEHDDDANYDYNEEEGGEDGDIQVGQEIDLTHEEVWDDSALIEAWDMAVKQYEVYHSKAGPSVNLKENSKEKEKIAKSAAPNSSNKHKHTDSTPQPSTSLTKRIKLNHSDGMATTSQNGTSSLKKESDGTTGSTSQPKARMEPDSSPTPTATQAPRAATSQYDVLERKPSFKKADKPTFNHHKERQEEIEKEKARKEKSSTSAAPSSLTAAAAPAVDAATIAYYQQLGYYYDPNYVVHHGTETASLDKEQGLEGDEYEDQLQSQDHQSQQEHGHGHGHRHDGSGIEVEAAGNNKVSGSAHPSSSYSSAPSKGNTKPTTSRAAHKNRAAYTIPNPYGPGPTLQHPSQPPYPTPHGFYPGYYPGHLPPTPPSHIPTIAPAAAAAGGAFGFPAGPGMPGFPGMPGISGMPGTPGMVLPGWNASGPAFGHGPSAAGVRGMMPPPPPPSFPHSGGSFAAPKMDDEALGNLIMAWYFSGYYTGLYQAQRR